MIRAGLIAVVLALLVPSIAVGDESTLNYMFSVNREIQLAKGRGDFGEAARLSRELREFMTGRSDVTAMHLNDITRIAQTMNLASRLPSTAQRELADAYQSTGDIHALLEAERFTDARARVAGLRDVFERCLGDSSFETSIAIAYEAEVARGVGDFEVADSLFDNVVRRRTALCGENHPAVASILSMRAWNILEWGRGDDPEAMLLKALAIQDSTLYPEHPEIAPTLVNLNLCYFSQGRFAEAEACLVRAIQIEKAQPSLSAAGYSKKLFNLATIYSVLSRSEDEVATYLEGIRILEDEYGPDAPLLLLGLVGLAGAYQSRGLFAEAEAVYTRVLAGSFDANQAGLIPALHNFATLCIGQRRYGDAEVPLARALKLAENLYGADSPAYAQGLAVLAQLKSEQGQLAQADQVLTRAIEIASSRGEQHPDVQLMLRNHAFLKRKQGQYPAACAQALRAWAGCSADFRVNSVALSQAEALNYADLLNNCADFLVNIALDDWPRDPIVWEVVADVIIRTKGMVSEMMSLRAQASRRGDLDEIRALRDRQRRNAHEQARLFHKKESSSNTRRETLQREAQVLERDLARAVKDIQLWAGLGNSASASLMDVLSNDSAILEYFQFRSQPLDTTRDSDHYAVLVLRKGRDPVVVDLGEAKTIERDVASYRGCMTSEPTGAGFDEVCHALFNRIWKPTQDLVSGVNRVYVSPDGALNLVSFASLMTRADHFLIEDVSVHYVPAARDLVRPAEVAPAGRGILLLGGVDYDAPTTKTVASPGSSRGSITLSCEAFMKKKWGPLDYTRGEVDSIKQRWPSMSKEPIHPRVGAAASELTVKKEASGHRIIHIATHGYFLDESCPESAAAGANPLLRSGLVLAGANSHARGVGSFADDGLLTAQEVATLDLRGVEAVVLTACETGLGYVRDREDVVGIRRAFQVAGAQAIVSALWSIVDEDTQFIAPELYRPGGEPLGVRLRRAQLEWIKAARAVDVPPDPRRWAGLVVVGERLPGPRQAERK